MVATALNGLVDGVGGLLWAPWTWVVVVLGVQDTGRYLSRPRRPAGDT